MKKTFVVLALAAALASCQRPGTTEPTTVRHDDGSTYSGEAPSVGSSSYEREVEEGFVASVPPAAPAPLYRREVTRVTASGHQDVASIVSAAQSYWKILTTVAVLSVLSWLAWKREWWLASLVMAGGAVVVLLTGSWVWGIVSVGIAGALFIGYKVAIAKVAP